MVVSCLSFPSWKRCHKMKEQLEPSIEAAGKCVLREGTNTPGVVSPQKSPSGRCQFNGEHPPSPITLQGHGQSWP